MKLKEKLDSLRSDKKLINEKITATIKEIADARHHKWTTYREYKLKEQERAYNLKEQTGMSFAAIGRKLGISSQKAISDHNTFRRAKWRLERDEIENYEFIGLSCRARNILNNLNITTIHELKTSMMRGGRLRHHKGKFCGRVRNAGPKTLRELIAITSH